MEFRTKQIINNRFKVPAITPDGSDTKIATLSESGLLRIALTASDNVIVFPQLVPVGLDEYHILRVEWQWVFDSFAGPKIGKEDLLFRVRRIGEGVPAP